MSFMKSVLIFGKSLSLAGIGACLKLDNNFNVLFVDPQDVNARQNLDELNPEAILFDLTDSMNYLDMQLLRKRPGILLIGVDPSCDEVLVFRGQRSRVVNTGELSMLISNKTGSMQVEQDHLAE